jgi:hypothetical protein
MSGILPYDGVPDGRAGARPRVLMVTFNRLFPANQGNARRIMQLVRFYRLQGFDVDLLYHNEEGFDVGLSDALAREFGRVTVIKSSSRKLILPGHVCRIADWYDAQLDAAARDMHRLRGYTLVHANYVWYSPLFEQFGPDVLKVMDTHDMFGERRQKYIAAGMAPQWFSTSYEEEDAAIRRVDVALAIQKEEAASFASRGHRNILYLPYVEPVVREFVPTTEQRPLTFGYLGSGNDWNVLSMNDLLMQLGAHPGTFDHPLVVAGGVTKHVRDFPSVIKIGFVQELHAFYDAIDIALNPMVGGTGLKIKTVEPLSYGRPVLTTRPGAEGVGHLWQLPIFEDNAEFAEYLVERFTARNADETLRVLLDQARETRAQLDEEYETQLRRFVKWLDARLGRAARVA